MFNDLKFDIFTRFIDVGEIFYHHRLITICFPNIKSQIKMGGTSSSTATGTDSNADADAKQEEGTTEQANSEEVSTL
jgi:hypothetical protein